MVAGWLSTVRIVLATTSTDTVNWADFEAAERGAVTRIPARMNVEIVLLIAPFLAQATFLRF
jgi:hypothetical protein